METTQQQKQINLLALPGIPETKKKKTETYSEIPDFQNLLYPDLKKIGIIVSDYYSMDLRTMNEENRKREIVQPRQISMTLAIEFTKFSLTRIGSFFGGKDHATVLHAKKTIYNLCDTDHQFRREVEYLRKLVARSLSKEYEGIYTYNIDRGKNKVDVTTNTHFTFQDLLELVNDLSKQNLGKKYIISFI